jgi:hypothetical protein
MSVMLWSAETLGNVASFLSPKEDPCRSFPQVCKNLATVSAANVAEFMETYKGRHGTPSPLTALEIGESAPEVADEKRARETLALLNYNALTADLELRAKATNALASLLSQAMIRLNELEQTA